MDSPTSNALQSLVYGDGVFVAVGWDGTIVSSTDGIGWELRDSGTNAWLFGVARGNGTFVAAGQEGCVLTSPNGADWTPQDSGTNLFFFDAGFGGGTFVLVGEGGGVMTSADGVKWAAQESNTEKWLLGVGYGAGTWVAVGSSGELVVSLPSGLSPLRLSSPAYLADGTFTSLILGAVSGQSLTVRWTVNFSEWGLVTNFTASGPSSSFTDAPPTLPGHRFYRVFSP
jgi:hypothetical protein